MNHPLSAACCATLTILLAAPAGADVVMLTSDHDNTLYEDSKGQPSNGAGSYFFAGMNGGGLIRRGLVSFDVAGSIPAGSTISAVTLTLYMSRTVAGTTPVGLHKVLAAWGEGATNAPNNEGTGDTALPGDATWLHTYSPSSFWSVPGGEFAPGASATQNVSGIASYSWSSAQLAADVQAWLDAPATNFGWAVRGSEPSGGALTSKRFQARENSNASQRPKLSITFTPPTPPVPFCFGDGSGVACPCGNVGAVGRGCDNAQATGGAQLSVASFSPSVPSVTFAGSGFSPAGSPTVIAIRSPVAAAPPTVFGDGLLCLEPPLVRFGASFATGGASTHTVGHGAGPGVFHYQLWYRNNPPSFCDAAAAFNLSNGVTLVWP